MNWVIVGLMKPVKGFHVGAKWLWFLALTSVGQLAAQPPTAPRNAHPLWEVRGKSNSVYLLGSIHFAKEEFYPLAKPIEQAYERCSSIVFEVNLGEVKSLETQTKLLKAGMCPAGETITNILLMVVPHSCWHEEYLWERREMIRDQAQESYLRAGTRSPFQDKECLILLVVDMRRWPTTRFCTTDEERI